MMRITVEVYAEEELQLSNAGPDYKILTGADSMKLIDHLAPTVQVTMLGCGAQNVATPVVRS